MAPQTTLRTLRTLRETKKREATCRALRATSRLLGWPRRPRITRLHAFVFEAAPPPRIPVRRRATHIPARVSHDGVMEVEGCAHFANILPYSTHNVYSTAKIKTDG